MKVEESTKGVSGERPIKKPHRPFASFAHAKVG